MRPLAPPLVDLDACVEETVAVGGGVLTILRPPDAEALLTDEAFDREELLPYWAELWSSALALAAELGPRALSGRRTLELGCGLGLVSLAAARAGARVTASDWSRQAAAMTALNAERNALAVETVVCAWERPEPLVGLGPWPLVLASDVLYERRNAELLLDLLPRLGDEILLADPGRPPAAPFLEAASREFEISSTTTPELANGAVHRLRRLRRR